jgi:methylmalonyl-CoA mutase
LILLIVALNKFDKRGALDAIRDVKKQYQRNHNLWDVNPDEMPVLGPLPHSSMTGMNTLYKAIMDKVVENKSDLKSTFEITREMSEKIYVIPHRTRYLSEIAESNHYDETALTQNK